MISKTASILIVMLPLIVGYAGHRLGERFVAAYRIESIVQLVPVVMATAAAYAAVRAIRAFLFWIAGQDLPDGDMPLAHPDRILGPARFLPGLVFAAALAHALLSTR